MRWTILLAACGALAACADGTARPRVARTPAPTPELHFVNPPVVALDGAGGVIVWVRLSRPFRDNEGLLGEPPNVPAEIRIPGTQRDIPGLYRDDLRPTCYGQFLYGDLEGGDPAKVALVLGDERLTATVPARDWEGTRAIDERALRRLGCPGDGGATRRCHGNAPGRYLGIGLQSATNASCRTARAVMRSAGRWVDSSRCYETLCVRKHRMNGGYRCSVDLTGEAAWQITCTRGDRVVRGSTAE
jgi:hypothetical protein